MQDDNLPSQNTGSNNENTTPQPTPVASTSESNPQQIQPKIHEPVNSSPMQMPNTQVHAGMSASQMGLNHPDQSSNRNIKKLVIGAVLGLLTLAIIGIILYGMKSNGSYELTNKNTVKGYGGTPSFSVEIPSKLQSSGNNTYKYQKGSSSVSSSMLFSQTAPSKETVEGFLIPYLSAHRVSNHSITGQLHLNYKDGVDAFEKVTINGQTSVLTRTDYKYQVAAEQSVDMAVLSLTTPCGNQQLCSFWITTSDPDWSNPKQSLVNMATSLKQK